MITTQSKSNQQVSWRENGIICIICLENAVKKIQYRSEVKYETIFSLEPVSSETQISEYDKINL